MTERKILKKYKV